MNVLTKFLGNEERSYCAEVIVLSVDSVTDLDDSASALLKCLPSSQRHTVILEKCGSTSCNCFIKILILSNPELRGRGRRSTVCSRVIMACPLSAILNPVNGSAQVNAMPATGDDVDDDAAISEASTEIVDEGMPDEEMPDKETSGFNNQTRQRRSPPDINPGMAICKMVHRTSCYPLTRQSLLYDCREA